MMIGTGTAGSVYCFENFLVPSAELEIRKTPLIPTDSLNKVVHFEYLHIEVAQSAARKLKAKEG